MAFHFMASLSLILHLLYHPMQGALKRILCPVFFSVDWDTKHKFQIFKQHFGHLVITIV